MRIENIGLVPRLKDRLEERTKKIEAINRNKAFNKKMYVQGSEFSQLALTDEEKTVIYAMVLSRLEKEVNETKKEIETL